MNEQVKQLEDKLVYVDAQLEAQKKETAAAEETLNWTSAEMEVYFVRLQIKNQQ